MQHLDSSLILKRYESVRRLTEQLAEPLSAEDCSIQSMPDASPTRWHMAHTTWFFETFLLKQLPGYLSPSPEFEQLFNSYYNSVSELFDRSRRGCLSRPDLDEVRAYRQHVDGLVRSTLDDGGFSDQQLAILEIGIHHEQQHQELILTDIKHGFACSPLLPTYHQSDIQELSDTPVSESIVSESIGAEGSETQWIEGPDGLASIGYAGDGFSFDNESPRHSFHLSSYRMASRTVTNAEYLQFINDGGYTRPEFWLSLGWDTVRKNDWTSPLYWKATGNQWELFTLAGPRPLAMNAPVCHISYFEADAYARWAGGRLPTEIEWEALINARSINPDSGLWSDQRLAIGLAIHPSSNRTNQSVEHAFGNVWEWTSSQYSAYPGYKPTAGALGEYNGKFMCNQFVLRGGSCATPSGHIRSTYRNFFPADTRWQFSGIRLAR